jgi:hypothetical protein
LVDAGYFIGVLAVVALGETPNDDPILLMKFHGLNHLFICGLVGAIPEINFFLVLKCRQTKHSLLIFIFVYLRGLIKFCDYGQRCRGLQFLSCDTKKVIIASVFWVLSLLQGDYFSVTKI